MKSKTTFLALAAIAALTSAVTHASVSTSCSSASVDSASYEGKNYVIVASVSCRVKSTSDLQAQATADVAGALKSFIQSASQVTSSEKSATVEGLAGEKFGISSSGSSNGATLNIESDVFVGHSDTKAVAISKSTSVSGTGGAKYVRAAASRIEAKLKDAKSLTVVVTHTVKVEKPLLIPGSMFEGPAQQSALEKLEENKSEIVSAVEGAI